MNKAILIGNLGKDPEVRSTPSGTVVANFSLATSERRKDEEHTEWHRCVAFNRTAEVIGEHLTKGSKIAVEGRIQTRKWTDKDGNDRYSTEILVDRFEFVESKGAHKPAERAERAAPEPEPEERAHAHDPFDDEIPF